MDVKEILQRGLDALRDDIIRRSNEAGQRASGKTYEQITVRNVTDTGGELWGPTWVAVLEDGRQPGKVPFDFAKIIMEWATHKGISWAAADPKQFERWARAVAWSIRRNGTRLYRADQKPDIFRTPVEEFERWLIEQLKEQYRITIINELRSAWQKNKKT